MASASQLKSATAEDKQRGHEALHAGKWILIHKGCFVGAFDSYGAAEAEGMRQFGMAPFSIRMRPSEIPDSFVRFHDGDPQEEAQRVGAASCPDRENEQETTDTGRRSAAQPLDEASNSKPVGEPASAPAPAIHKNSGDPKFLQIAPLSLAAARKMIEQFGEKAENEAGERADKCVAFGDVAGQSIWLLVIDAIRDLRRGTSA